MPPGLRSGREIETARRRSPEDSGFGWELLRLPSRFVSSSPNRASDSKPQANYLSFLMGAGVGVRGSGLGLGLRVESEVVVDSSWVFPEGRGLKPAFRVVLAGVVFFCFI